MWCCIFVFHKLNYVIKAIKLALSEEWENK